MAYVCPHKGTSLAKKTCREEFGAIRGWKRHMTMSHGQFSDQELAAVVGAAPLDPEHGRSLFLAEMGGKPETPGQETEAREKTGVGGEDTTKEPAPEQQKKIVPIKMKKFKKALAALPEKFLKAKGIVPDEDDKEMIEGATEILEEMFGVSLEVPETAWIIRSRFLALLFPMGAMLLIWAKHEFKLKLTVSDAKKEESVKPNGDAEPKINSTL